MKQFKQLRKDLKAGKKIRCSLVKRWWCCERGATGYLANGDGILIFTPDEDHGFITIPNLNYLQIQTYNLYNV